MTFPKNAMIKKSLTFATKLPPGLRTCVVILRACEYKHIRSIKNKSYGHCKHLLYCKYFLL